MKNIREIEAKSILTRSKLPETDYCVNPYVGCLHNCVYCYARFMKRFTGHTENWGSFLDIKKNAVEILTKELKKSEKGLILLSSVTDPYQPIERQYLLTREILNTILQFQFPVSILTKSTLVLRDIDILKQFNYVEVGLTITSTSDEVSTTFEPMASKATERIKTLKNLNKAKIRTYAFIGPILPGITDIEKIFRELNGNVDSIMVEALNPKCGNWDEIVYLIKNQYPKISDDFISNTFNRQYWMEIENQILNLCSTYNLPLRGFYFHGATSKK